MADLPNGLLRRGQHGPRVKLLQQKLAEVGHDPGGADGVFGNKTLAAVKAFQRAYGLAPDGLVGRKTISTLNAACEVDFVFDEEEAFEAEADDPWADFGPLAQGSEGDEVVTLQELLQAMGYPVDPSGQFDAVTETSLMDFQASYSIDPTGVAEADTMAALEMVAAMQAPSS